MTSTVARSGRGPLCRAEILREAPGAAPWALAGPAAAHLEANPDDHEVRLALAEALARLGLVTLAGAALAGLPDHWQQRPEPRRLRELIRQAPDDSLPPDRLIATCRANLEASVAPDAPAAAALESWQARLSAQQWYIAADGNVVRRARDERRPWLWQGLKEQKQAAAALAAKLAAVEPLPITLEGADPPWLLAALAEAPARPNGHRVRVSLVQADPLELLDGLALVDLREALREGRIEIFCGEDATRRFAHVLEGRLGARIRSHSITLPTVRRRAQPAPGSVIDAAEARQQDEARRLLAEVETIYARRDRPWWARRYAEASAGGRPLRVLLPACRYSTFVRHASRSLLQSFERAGYQARLLIEPDEFTHLSLVSYLRAVAEFKPDLVVLINYTRANLGQALPRNLPAVTWIQDAMAHLLDPKVGAQQGEFDFLAGHLLPELFDRFGYPRQRALHAPVVVDQEKFHDDPVAPELRERFACELALVSHHGEEPGALHARLVGQANADPRMARICEALRPRIERIARSGRELIVHHELRSAIAEVVEGALEPAQRPRAEALLLRQYALPMADRLFRHELVEWAADLCARERWRLRLYGRGWENARFAECARPEVAHGEELRACYQAATAHLHASINTAVHQRVMECALSGGLPLVRLHRELVEAEVSRASAQVARRGAMAPHGERMAAMIADHPEYLGAAAQLQRLGYAVRPRFSLERAQHEAVMTGDAPRECGPIACDLLGDLSQTGFVTREQFEARLRRAIERPGWRRAAGEAVARRVRERWTTDVLVADMVRMAQCELA
ncbi:MAG: hypothetical protein ACF8R7_02720 [Phycisphaerales bacterium JB039]